MRCPKEYITTLRSALIGQSSSALPCACAGRIRCATCALSLPLSVSLLVLPRRNAVPVCTDTPRIGNSAMSVARGASAPRDPALLTD